jgi:hypothetical protein
LSNPLFDDPELLALMDGCEVGKEELRLPGEPLATPTQIQYIKDLLELTLGDEEDYDFKTITISEASEAIGDLEVEASFLRKDFK